MVWIIGGSNIIINYGLSVHLDTFTPHWESTKKLTLWLIIIGSIKSKKGITWSIKACHPHIIYSSTWDLKVERCTKSIIKDKITKQKARFGSQFPYLSFKAMHITIFFFSCIRTTDSTGRNNSWYHCFQISFPSWWICFIPIITQ